MMTWEHDEDGLPGTFPFEFDGGTVHDKPEQQKFRIFRGKGFVAYVLQRTRSQRDTERHREL